MKKLVLLALLTAPLIFAQTQDAAARGLASSTFANLGTPANGTIIYCSDCTSANPAAGSGSGAVARRENGAWNSGGGSTGANAALSNLASVSVNTSLLAQTGVDLGSTTAPFRSVFIWGSGTYGSTYLQLFGSPTGNRVVTFPDSNGTVVYASQIIPTSPNGSITIGNTGTVAPTLDVSTSYGNGLWAQLAASNGYSNGTKQTFGLSSTTAGLRMTVGTLPSAQSGGDLFMSSGGWHAWNDGSVVRASTYILSANTSLPTAITAGKCLEAGTNAGEIVVAASNGACGSGGTGTVTSSGTPLVHQMAVWTTATNAIGITVGTDNTVLHGHTGADPSFSTIVAADITSATITGTQIASSIALAGSPTTTTQSQNDNSTKIATTAYVDRPVLLPAAGTSVSLSAPREYYVCSGTCTVTPPVPAAGYEFCVRNADNVATVITLAALGSSARYEATARNAYGSAGTGTFVSGGALTDQVCIVGLDSTHYLTMSYTGTWVAN